jgi:hypothetical protein
MSKADLEVSAIATATAASSAAASSATSSSSSSASFIINIISIISSSSIIIIIIINNYQHHHHHHSSSFIIIHHHHQNVDKPPATILRLCDIVSIEGAPVLCTNATHLEVADTGAQLWVDDYCKRVKVRHARTVMMLMSSMLRGDDGVKYYDILGGGDVAVVGKEAGS